MASSLSVSSIFSAVNGNGKTSPPSSSTSYGNNLSSLGSSRSITPVEEKNETSVDK